MGHMLRHVIESTLGALSALVGTQSQTTCYSGMYGSCATCDSRGSCICPALSTGHADLVTRDRTEWGGIVLTCPTVPSILNSMYAAGLFAAGLVLLRGVVALRSQLQQTRSLQRPRLSQRPIWILGLILAATCLTIGLCIRKLVDHGNLIGFDVTATVCYSVGAAMLYIAGAIVIVDFLDTALRAQASIYGKKELRDYLDREAFMLCKWAALMVFVTCLPLVSLVAVKAGHVDEDFQALILVMFLLGHTIGTVWGHLRTQTQALALTDSFEMSIAALKDSYMIAMGGKSMADAWELRHQESLERSALIDADEAPLPAAVAHLLEKLSALEEAQAKLQTEAGKMRDTHVMNICSYVLFVSVPYMWDKIGYLFACSFCLFVPLGFSLPVVAAYTAQQELSKKSA